MGKTDDWVDREARNNNSAAVAIKAYLQSGNIKDTDQIPDAADTFSLSYFAAGEIGSSTAADAFLDIVVHRISTRDHSVADKFSGEFAYRCAMQSTSAYQNRRIVDVCQQRELADLSIALFWMTYLGKRGGFNFHSVPDQYFAKSTAHFPAEVYLLEADYVAQNEFEALILDLSDEDLLQLLQHYKNVTGDAGKRDWRPGPLQGVLARQRPEVIRKFIDSVELGNQAADETDAIDWRFIVGATDIFDKDCIERGLKLNNANALIVLNQLRPSIDEKTLTALCMQQPCNNCAYVLEYLHQSEPALFLEKFIECFAGKGFFGTVAADSLTRYCEQAANEWDNGGEKLFTQFKPEDLSVQDKLPFSQTYSHTLIQAASIKAAAEVTKEATTGAKGNPQAANWVQNAIRPYRESNTIWLHAAKEVPSLFEEEFWQLLEEKQKDLRAVAVTALSHKSIKGAVAKADKLLEEGAVDAKIGAVELLTAIGGRNAIDLLQAAVVSGHSAKIQQAITRGLESLGAEITLDLYLANSKAHPDAAKVLSDIESKPAAKPPKSSEWLVQNDLPELVTRDGETLSEKAVAKILLVQSGHKTINAAPDILPLIALVDRDKSGDFAIEILKQFLASEQAATGRWALTLAGLFGDKRVLPMLSEPIKGWAEASRHKLAEYSAQAISLVDEDESLILLTALVNRYRTKYRNIGKACQAALERTAKKQGVSMDELEDRIVPTLDFDTEYQRSLPDTTIKAVLQPDFKLTFYNPDKDAETKSPPASLPASAVDEIKIVRKLIRETIKGQTARLEQALVRQRSWPTARWQELFEVNPFLQSYASRLVWSTLDDKGQVRQLFRRYPNGLLADAGGELIELDKKDIDVVIAHPLMLEEQALKDWRDHLKRMKIKPPFPQLDRPVATLEDTHANRKNLDFTDQHEMASGTFRSRLEKRGWIRGSVVDGGGISSYYKLYPGAATTAILMVEWMYIGQDPSENAKLGTGLFVKVDSVTIGSYTYDEPNNTDDPRVVKFADVAPVVYSETVSDLQAIIG